MREDKIKIEHGIKMPSRRLYHKSKWKSLLEQMSVGDSFAIKDGDINTARQSVSRYQRTSGTKKQWTIRKNNPTTWRCWRVK
jgi:hypothetical protein